jgi:hypothetical protein
MESMQQTFDAELLKVEGMDAAYIRLPFPVAETFGVKGLVRVRGAINGSPFRAAAMPDGAGLHCVGLTKALRRELGLTIGDILHVTLEPDVEERSVEMPDDLAEALAREPRARAFFDALSYTNRKEYAAWISGAKRAGTRAGRLERAVRMLLDGIRHP